MSADSSDTPRNLALAAALLALAGGVMVAPIGPDHVAFAQSTNPDGPNDPSFPSFPSYPSYPSYPVDNCDGEVCFPEHEQPTDPFQVPDPQTVPPNAGAPPIAGLPAGLTVEEPTDAEAERKAGGTPITGSGNGDLWSGHGGSGQ